MATHSSILVWKISWTEDPGGVQSMGPQSVAQDWAHMHAVEHLNIREYIMFS